MSRHHRGGRGIAAIRSLLAPVLVPLLALCLVVVPAFWSFGAFIEYVRARAAYNDMQLALDGLLIEAVSGPLVYAQGGIDPQPGDLAGDAGIRVRTNADGSVTAAMIRHHDTTFWRLLGYPHFVYPVKATAYREYRGGREVIRIVRGDSALAMALSPPHGTGCAAGCGAVPPHVAAGR